MFRKVRNFTQTRLAIRTFSTFHLPYIHTQTRHTQQKNRRHYRRLLSAYLSFFNLLSSLPRPSEQRQMPRRVHR